MTIDFLDTNPEVLDLQRRLLMRRSGGERLEMATSMFGAAKALVESRLIEAGITDPVQRKVAMFRQLYEPDLDRDTVARVVRHLSGRASG